MGRPFGGLTGGNVRIGPVCLLTVGRMRRIVAVGAAVLTIAGCGTGSSIHARHASLSTSPTPTVSATPTSLSLQPVLEINRGDVDFPNWQKTATGCKGTDAYADLHVNGGVTLYAANEDVAGSGFITDAQVDGKKCVLTATVDDVVPGDFYEVQFGNHNKVAFSRQQLEDQSAVLTIE